MTAITQILSAAQSGDKQAAAQLLPLLYSELRKLAETRLAKESSPQTLNATALVHEAYLRLVGPEDRQKWDGCEHFFGAAAEAMRQILVEAARRRQSQKRGGGAVIESLNGLDVPLKHTPEEILALHDALQRFAQVDAKAAKLVVLRYFAGFTIPESAEILGISPRTANDLWSYARAWLAVRVRNE